MAAEHAAVIGARIREAREATYIDGHRMSQRELAEKIPGRADGTQISKWERGKNRVGDDTLEHIARILKRDVAWFHTTMPDKSETPDVLASLNGSEPPSQLNRIEAMLDEIYFRLTGERYAAAASEVVGRLPDRLSETGGSPSTKAPPQSGNRREVSRRKNA